MSRDQLRQVLFVCTANICRSAFAELLARHRVGDRLEISSAGTHGWPEHPVDADMAVELAGRGVDAGAFRSRRLSAAILAEADVVLTAGAEHRTYILEDHPAAVRKTFSLGQFAAGLDAVPPDVSGAALLAGVRRARPTARVEEDVADPYRRGPEAAAAAAGHLEHLLAEVLPRLSAAGGPGSPGNPGTTGVSA